jgi:hypothetical protein
MSDNGDSVDDLTRASTAAAVVYAYRVGGQLGQMDWIPDLVQRYGLNSPL